MSIFLMILVFFVACESAPPQERRAQNAQVYKSSPSATPPWQQDAIGDKSIDNEQDQNNLDVLGDSQDPNGPLKAQTGLSIVRSFDELYLGDQRPHTRYTTRRIIYGYSENALGEQVELVGLYGRAEDLPRAPGIILLHGEKTGLTVATIEPLLLHFVAYGYRVLAIDLYAGIVPANESQASDLEERLINKGIADTVAHIRQAKEHMQSKLDTSLVMLAGVGLGGTLSLRAGIIMKEQIKAVVNFYGDPLVLNEAESGNHPSMFMMMAGEDEIASNSEVAALRERVSNGFPRVEFKTISGVASGFVEASRSLYDPVLTKSAVDSAAKFIGDALLDDSATP